MFVRFVFRVFRFCLEPIRDHFITFIRRTLKYEEKGFIYHSCGGINGNHVGRMRFFSKTGDAGSCVRYRGAGFRAAGGEQRNTDRNLRKTDGRQECTGTDFGAADDYLMGYFHGGSRKDDDGRGSAEIYGGLSQYHHKSGASAE